jgi:hypothetical protein
MPDRDELLRRAIAEKSETHYQISTKQEVIDYYRGEYKGKPDAQWKTAAAKALAELAGKGGDAKAIKNERRNFESDRLHKESKTAKWAKFGASLPKVLKPKGNEITITINAKQKDSKKGTRDRTISVTFRGVDAFVFANNPNYDDIWDEYGWNFDQEEDGDYALDIYSVS